MQRTEGAPQRSRTHILAPLVVYIYIIYVCQASGAQAAGGRRTSVTHVRLYHPILRKIYKFFVHTLFGTPHLHLRSVCEGVAGEGARRWGGGGEGARAWGTILRLLTEMQ